MIAKYLFATVAVVLFGFRPGCEPADIESSSSALTVAPPNYAFDLRERLDGTTCTAGVCDLTDELKDILEECNETPPIDRSDTGCSIHIAAGEYELTETIVLCRQHHIYGDGGWGAGARTVINVAAETTGFRLGSTTECEDYPPRTDTNGDGGFGGKNTEISDLAIYSEACTGTCTAADHFGVHVNARGVQLSNLYIKDFTQGVRISGDVTRTGCGTTLDPDLCSSNANLWMLSRVRVDDSDHAGVYVQGGDTNGGLGMMVSGRGNCQDPTSYETAWGDCANIVDKSFLGSAWVGTHTAAVTATTDVAPGYIADGNSQMSVFVGAYAEGDQLQNELSVNSTAVGGLSSWDGASGLRIEGRDIRGHMRVHNAEDPNNETYVQMGDQVDGTFMEFTSRVVHSSKPVRFGINLHIADDAPGACTSGMDDPLEVCTVHTGTVNGVACHECIDGWFEVMANYSRALQVHMTPRSNVAEGNLLVREPFFVDGNGVYQSGGGGGAPPIETEVCPSDVDNDCGP